MICRLTPKSCVMYAGLRLAKTFVCCCPDQLNKRLTDSKIESVRRKLCSVRANSTFVVASSQSQRIAFMTRSATVTFAIKIMADWLPEELGSLCTKLLLCSVRASKNLNVCLLLLYCHTKTFVGYSRLMYARH